MISRLECGKAQNPEGLDQNVYLGLSRQHHPLQRGEPGDQEETSGMHAGCEDFTLHETQFIPLIPFTKL